jgi:hypothetical protein
MSLTPFRLLTCALLALGLNIFVQPADYDLTVHEWGTFTSVAGEHGEAIDWLPLSGPTDLPGFVAHLRNAAFKVGIRGTVRMETPVLYFYAPREMTVSVKVAFPRGLITEWYPTASQVATRDTPTNLRLQQADVNGGIAWNSVSLVPDLTVRFPREAAANRYYAARQTSATPVRVKTRSGEQYEKFLFYRGVAAFQGPILAMLTNESQLRIANLGADEIPNLIYFERRRNRVGYRVTGGLQNEITVDPPELTGTIENLCINLGDILVAQGLYADEAQAMIKTWRDSWLEEGSRLFYIVPARFVDKILPLSINPAPAQKVRVFVGRIELITPATRTAVETVLATHDHATLGKYDRFLEPILRTIKDSNSVRARQVTAVRTPSTIQR